VALALRRVDGLSRAAFAEEFGADPGERYGDAIEVATRDGLVELTDSTLRLTPQGRLLASNALLPFLPERAVAGVA
jgi:oxygen-independent coproporphyrinogen-3 oxidase